MPGTRKTSLQRGRELATLRLVLARMGRRGSADEYDREDGNGIEGNQGSCLSRLVKTLGIAFVLQFSELFSNVQRWKSPTVTPQQVRDLLKMVKMVTVEASERAVHADASMRWSA